MATASRSDADDASPKTDPNEDDSTPTVGVDSEGDSTADDATPATDSNGDSSTSVADRLATAARILWVAFLAVVVVFTLIPVVGVLAGVTPFPAPDPLPYYALVGFAIVGTVAIVGTAIYDA